MAYQSEFTKDERPAHRRSAEAPESPDVEPPSSPNSIAALQRTFGNQWVQRQIAASSASAGPAGGPLEDDVSRRIQAERAGGRPLDASERSTAEQALGADLSAVRVHTGPAAAELNQQLGARAFTTGRDIFFGADASPADPDVLVHESAHAVQQGMSTDPPAAVGAADTSFEQAADSAAHSAQLMRQSPQEEEQAGVASRLLQREEDPEQNQSVDQPLPSMQVSFQLPDLAATDYTDEEIAVLVPGYVPSPQEDVPSTTPAGTAMALRTPAAGVVQRDPPHLEPALVGQQYPWQVGFQLTYADLSLHTFYDRLGALDFLHEPSAQITWSPDPTGWLAGQLALPILNQHLRLWGRDFEAQIAAQVGANLAPQFTPSYGGQFQVEEQIWRGLSATFSIGGMYTPPAHGDPGHLDFSATTGFTLQLDGGR